MACCYPEDCGEYAVAPMLIAPCYPTKCCEDPPMCFPCLPRCPKTQMVYCCEKKSKTPSRTPSNHDGDYCDGHHSRQHRDSTPPHRGKCSSHSDHNTSSATNRTPPNYCPTCCQPTCKPVKTKYIIPCYRYEDGRINQPTVLMRRACEVAVGRRARRAPFVETSYSADPYNEVHRYHSEDERGNCCFHFERKKPSSAKECCAVSKPCQPCASSPQCQYVDCVHARTVDSTNCCYYC